MNVIQPTTDHTQLTINYAIAQYFKLSTDKIKPYKKPDKSLT